MKKLKKKTGKRVEIVSKKEDQKDSIKGGEDSTSEQIQKQVIMINSLLFDFVGDSEIYTMFSDENANACSIM